MPLSTPRAVNSRLEISDPFDHVLAGLRVAEVEDELLIRDGRVEELCSNVLDQRCGGSIESPIDAHVVLVHRVEVRALAEEPAPGERVNHRVDVTERVERPGDDVALERRGGKHPVLHEVVEDGPVAADGVAYVADALAVKLDHLGTAARADGDDLAGVERLGDGRA